MAIDQHEDEQKEDGHVYDSSTDDDSSSSSGSSSSGSSSSGSSSSGSSSSGSGSGDDSDDDGTEEENFEIGFWESLKAAMPWTELGKEADYAEERLDAHEEFQEELDEALRIRKMVETGLHDKALDCLMASTEGQMYHHFHKHRYELEQTGEWSFIPPSVKRKWRRAPKRTDKVEKLRAYMAMRRDRFLRIRGLCRLVRLARGNSSDLVVTVVPESLIDENLLGVAGGGELHKPAGTFGGTRLKKCHWQDITSKGEHCTCTNYRMEHPHRLFKDEFGVLIHDTLATCGWHATRCVSNAHGDHPVIISTANEGALCNECLVQLTKGPIRSTTAFGAPGVRFKNKRAGSADTDPGAGGDEFLAWNKWFTKGPGRARKGAIRPRHPQAPPGLPPAGLRPPIAFVPPPPPPPVFSMANFRRQKKLAAWRLHKEEKGKWAATAVQRTYRGYRARHLRAMVALEHPLRARLRAESTIVMQSLVRRFLARTLVRQIAAFRNVNATAIQRMARGMQARALFRRKRARAIVQRQMLFFLTRAFVASARVARRIREEMRKKNAVALSLQRAWRGKKGREKAALLRAFGLRRHGAAITTQKVWRCFLAKRELEARRMAHQRQIRAAIVMQSISRMFMDKRRVEKWKQGLDTAARRVQPLIRGLLARVLARRERALLGQVWGWLGTDSATANDIYARFLPKNAYSSVRGEGSNLSSVPLSAGGAAVEDCTGGESLKEPGTASSLSRTSLETLPGERHFTEKFDKDRTGTCSKVEFKLGLESFLREVGYPLQREEATLIVKRYFDGDGFCAWHSFLNSYHAGSNDGACTRHGRLLCTLCMRHGRCEKPGCSCTKAHAGRSKQLGFKMCQCGHVFDAHALVTGGSKPAQRPAHGQRGWVLPQNQLNSLLSKGPSKATADRPINVEGCSASSTIRARHADALTFVGGRAKPSPVATTSCCQKTPSWRRNPGRRKRPAVQETHPGREGEGGVTALSLAELSPPFFGNRSTTATTSSPPRSRQNLGNQHRNENVMACPETRGASPTSPHKRNASLPTMLESRIIEKERRDASWTGRRGQAERAALAEMTSTVQGRNAADYAARLQDDIATNTSVVDGPLCLAPVMSKKELRQGFAISAAVPFVKAGTLKVTTDPIGLYLYLLKALSDERHELLEDDRRFTDFVARHAVFLERHWCKLVKDIRNGGTDPHLPITEAKRMRVEGLMIPNKKRAQRLDDRLRVLGFHARASGIYKTAASTSATGTAPATKTQLAAEESSGMGGEAGPADRRGRSAGSRPLTQEEKQESMAKMVEACKKRRPGTTGGESGVGQRTRRKRRTVTGGEMESAARLLKSREGSRARSPSTGAVQAIPTAEEASKTAYELQTAASANAAGVVQAPSGRGVRKHVCLHPGCGKVFHLKASALTHQEKEHHFRRRLAAPTPLTDQFMSPVWPSDGVPWVPGSPSSQPLTACRRRGPRRRIMASTKSPPGRRTPNTGGGRSGSGSRVPTTGDAVLHRDEANLQARFACGVPGCGHRFPEARLLGLHLRMGHSNFDLERMKAAREGTEPTCTLDGVSITASIDVGGHVRASFLGAYRLVPPFQSPDECPVIPACTQHGRLKPGCRRCNEVAQQSAAAVAGDDSVDTRLPFGLPLPPAKFYTRAMVVVRHHGRPIKLDLDCSETLRCPLLSFPRTPDASMDPAERHRAPHCAEDDDASEGVMKQPTGNASEACLAPAISETPKCDGREEQQDGTSSDATLDGGGSYPTSTARKRTDASGRIRSVDENADAVEVDDENNALPHPHRIDQDAQHEPSGNQHHLYQQQEHQHDQHHHQDPHQHRGGLVPARLVAVLVDGSGKGWMAARRLWSVDEVGVNALAEAGLTMGDVDVEQEFLVGTEVEYLPLSLVRDTCAVKVDRRDDVHSKQRLGDLPKPLRYVSHGIDSATGTVLLESELKLRENNLLLGGGR